MGRVLEMEGILRHGREPQSLGKKLWYMFRRFESDEIPRLPLRISFNGYEKTIKTDEEGFFDIKIDLREPLQLPQTRFLKAKIEATENPYTEQEAVSAECEIMMPGSQARFVIVSDVDDTIIKSYAGEFFLKIRTLLMNNASARTPFEGVAEFYQRLQDASHIFNPLYFVSGSSWNIYDLLYRFCREHEIPKGPILLRQLGVDKEMLFKKGTREFKLLQIKQLLADYPGLPFILVGDSGQKDPEIYYQLVKEHPGRIITIYIRDLGGHVSPERKRMIEELRSVGVDMLLISHTNEAANHAREKGWINDY